ncbi:L-serine dehydratase, iron-sulfur-dependent, beta subunit, partial [human gut metagenome]
MRLFDVLGPVMTGPSSSHTAGAVRIGLTARNLLGEAPKTA